MRQRRKDSPSANDGTEAAASAALVPFSDVLDEPPPFDLPDESNEISGGRPELEEAQDWVVHVRGGGDNVPPLTAEAGAAAAPRKAPPQEENAAVETSEAGAAPAATGKVYVLPPARLAPKPRRKSSGLIRVAACLITGVTLVAWHLEQRPQPADAAEPPTATARTAPQGPTADDLAQHQRALEQIEAGDASEGATLLNGALPVEAEPAAQADAQDGDNTPAAQAEPPPAASEAPPASPVSRQE